MGPSREVHLSCIAEYVMRYERTNFLLWGLTIPRLSRTDVLIRIVLTRG